MPDGELVVPIGKARVAREGKDVSIITYAAMLHVALEAAEAAAADGIDGRGARPAHAAAARRGGDPGHGRARPAR